MCCERKQNIFTVVFYKSFELDIFRCLFSAWIFCFLFLSSFKYFDQSILKLLHSHTRPTRITPNCKTLIDNIFTNFITAKPQACNLICTISDHLPQIVNLDMKPAKPIQLKSTKRDLRKFERNDFLLDFLSIDWGDSLHGKSSSEKLNIFISKTNSV